jgi:tetratricopeptide (TPR) repeat protein
MFKKKDPLKASQTTRKTQTAEERELRQILEEAMRFAQLMGAPQEIFSKIKEDDSFIELRKMLFQGLDPDEPSILSHPLVKKSIAHEQLAIGKDKYKNGDYEGAAGDFKTAFLADSQESAYLINYGMALKADCRYAEALKVFTSAAMLYRDLIEPFVEAIECAILLEDLASAKDLLNLLENKKKNDSEAYSKAIESPRGAKALDKLQLLKNRLQ